MIIDISRTLSPAIAVWPGDTPFNLQSTLSLSAGDSVNLTALNLSAHTGSHIDAPYHFQQEGRSVEALPLDTYWGPAQVVTIQQQDGALLPAAFEGYDLTRAPRLLVRTASSEKDPREFSRAYVYPSPELAPYLHEQGILLYGCDAPSMDSVDSKTLPGHHALQTNGIAILEALDLSRVEDGLYELSALPLKIAGGDGSPVRAALRSLPGG
jgi:arylformamidase